MEQNLTHSVMGGIIGDVCGSIYQFKKYKNVKPKAINLINPRCCFTDDSVMTVATMHACLVGGRTSKSFGEAYRTFGLRWPTAEYGEKFWQWVIDDTAGPYDSWGNGSAMRVGPVGWLPVENLDRVLEIAKETALPTHNHPEGIKGAQAIAAAVYLARGGDGKSHDKEEIKSYIETVFDYYLSRSLDDIRPDHVFDVSCQGTVPVALIAFLESESFEHALQLAISVGGDADTLACITGAVAGAYYREVPEDLARFAEQKTKDFANTITCFVRQIGE